MSNLMALASALLTIAISGALAALVWLLTGSELDGWIAMAIAVNPVWLLVARFFDPRQVRWR